MLEKLFKLKQNNTNVKTEVMAGITTFMTMAYILAVNPNFLSAAGMDKSAVLIATALASFVGTALMALFSNYPFALAPGMGLNAYFAFTVAAAYDWRIALLAVFAEGIIFILLSVTNVREAIFNAIPMTLKAAVSAGIGLFIAFIGLQNANIVIDDPSTLVTYQKFHTDFNSVGMGALLALIGIVITGILLVKKVKGGILLGILATWILGIICELTGLYKPNIDLEMYSTIPTAFISFDFSSLGKTFGQVFQADFSALKNVAEFIVVIFAFLFVDIFDTLGTLIGVSSKANMLDKDGKLPRIKGALLADAIATTVGAVFGTSTTTTYVESASGVTEGGRTGLTAMVTGFLFLISIIFSPLFLTIPSFATAPALVIVGVYMIASVAKIDWENMLEAIPAFLCIIAMPLMYSISEGIAIGVISWALIHLCTGKAKGKVSILMYVLTVLFILKYIFL